MTPFSHKFFLILQNNISRRYVLKRKHLWDGVQRILRPKSIREGTVFTDEVSYYQDLNLPKEENNYQTLELHELVTCICVCPGLKCHVKRTRTSICSNCTDPQINNIQTANIKMIRQFRESSYWKESVTYP